MSRFVQLYMRLLEKHPWRTTALTTGTLQVTGDFIAQTGVEKTPIRELDWRRSSRFFLIGVVCVGPALRCWYRILENIVHKYGFSRLVPLQKVIVDQTIYAPNFIAFFLSSMTFWKTYSIDETKKKMKNDYMTVLRNNYKWWPWVQTINFYLVPLQYRVLFSNSASVLWNTYLSYKTNTQVDSPGKEAQKL